MLLCCGLHHWHDIVMAFLWPVVDCSGRFASNPVCRVLGVIVLSVLCGEMEPPTVGVVTREECVVFGKHCCNNSIWAARQYAVSADLLMF